MQAMNDPALNQLKETNKTLIIISMYFNSYPSLVTFSIISASFCFVLEHEPM